MQTDFNFRSALTACVLILAPLMSVQSHAAISVQISPSGIKLLAGQTQTFQAAVTGTTDQRVVWSVNGVVGGSAQYGTITNSGVFTAPSSGLSGITSLVSAQSVADGTQSGFGLVMVSPVVLVSLSPASATVAPSKTQQFTATVTGTATTGVNWAVNGIAGGSGTVGSISTSGLYMAPVVTSPLSVQVSATSTADGAKFATATVAVQPPVSVSVSPASAAIDGGKTQQFVATVTGATNTGVTWAVNSVVGGNGSIGTVSPSGLYTPPASLSSPLSVTVNATSTADSTKSAQSVVTVQPVVQVSLAPASVTLIAGKTQQFTPGVTGTMNAAVTWSVNGVMGGNSSVGTVSVAGLYTAPASLSSPLSVTVNAISVADSTKSAQSVVTVQPVVSVSLSPASVTLAAGKTQQFTPGVTGTTNTAVTWSVNGVVGGNSSVGTVSVAGLYIAPASISSPLSATVTATSAADSTKSAQSAVTVQPVVSVSLAPASVQMGVGRTQQFTPGVAGTTNTAVTWSVNGVVGGNSSVGTVSVAGLYAAPPSLPLPLTATVTAASVADGTKSAQATVTVQPPVTVSVSPASQTVNAGQTRQFTATVGGTLNTDVTWMISPAVGTISPSGLYAAPSSLTLSQTVTVTATSVADTTQTAAATITLPPTCLICVAGGRTTAYTDPQGLVWAPDSGYNGGNAYSNPQPISGTTATALYQTQRYYWVPLQYQFTVPNGDYTVTLKFAELVYDKAGARVFHIALNGQTVLTNFDVVAQAGAAFTALDRTFQTTVTNGKVNLLFTPVVNSPIICAIEIQATSTVSPANIGISVSPATASVQGSQTQQFSASITGTTYTGVTWSINPAVGTISRTGLYAAAAGTASAQTVTVTATSAADATKTAQAVVTIQPTAAMAVSPSSAALNVSQTQQFTATIGGTSASGVTWSINPAVGTISATGLYVAPASSTSVQTVTVKATSVADPTKSAQATVTVKPPVTVSVSPVSATIYSGQSQQFVATVNGASNGAVTWLLRPAVGSISASGLYAAPSTVSSVQSVTIQATSVADPSKSATTAVLLLDGTPIGLDPYGGWTKLSCSNGPTRFFYTQKMNNRWWLCTPSGNVFWMKGVFNVSVSTSVDDRGVSYAAVATQKYGDTDATWGPQQNRRLLSWGFNSTAEYSSRYVQPTATVQSWVGGKHPVPMPFTAMVWPANYSLRNSGGYAPGPVKELVKPTSTTFYKGYRSNSPDVWDPNFKAWLVGALQKDFSVHEWLTGPNNDYLIGLQVDDIDSLQGFGAGADFKTVANGVASGGRESVHLSWIIMVTPPTQTTSAEFGLTYTDTTVYSKVEFRNFMQARYATIAALNAAWGSNYTTFDTAGGWGVGSGLLDENGSHSWIPKDFTRLSDAPAAMKVDLDDFLFHHAQKYFNDVRSAIQMYAPGRLYLGPTSIGGWGAPPRRQILQAASTTVDVLGVPSVFYALSDDQARADFFAQYGGDKPWLSWEGMMANPDSYMSAFPTPDTVTAPSTTQAERGTRYAGRVTALLNRSTSSGVFPVVGMKFWELVDNWGERSNWGMVTRRDNPYDGIAAEIKAGVDAWGFPTGLEDKDYGDFLSAVKAANFLVNALIR